MVEGAYFSGGRKTSINAQPKAGFRQKAPVAPDPIDFAGFATALERHLLPHLGALRGRRLKVLDVGYACLEELISVRSFADRCGLEVKRLVGIEASADKHRRSREMRELYEHDGALVLLHGDARNARELVGEDGFDLVVFRHPDASKNGGRHIQELLESVKSVAAPGAIFVFTFYDEVEMREGKRSVAKAGLGILEAKEASQFTGELVDSYVLVASAPC